MALLCSCGRPAVYGITNNGPFMCIPCWNEHQRNLNQTLALDMAMLSHLEQQMSWIAGVPHTGPTLHVPQPTYVHAPISMKTTNNIRVESGSQVGQINAGAINYLNTVVTTFNEVGAASLATALREFTQAVVDSTDISAKAQKEVLDGLSFLAKEACAEKKQRNVSVSSMVLQNISTLVTAVAELSEHWDKLKQMFGTLLT